MNRGTRMSSALAMVTPRPVGGASTAATEQGLAASRPSDAASATVATTCDEPACDEPALAVVAQVPDVNAKADPNAEATASHSKAAGNARWNANWKLPRPKFRLAYVKIAAALMRLDLAACWAWAISLPPIVKLGTVMASLVMSLWMLTGGDGEPQAEPAPAPAWHQDGAESAVDYSAGKANASKSAASTSVATCDSCDKPAGEASPTQASPLLVAHEHRPSAEARGPSIRDIQEAAGASRAASRYDDRWPDEIAAEAMTGGRVATATVRPIPSHREPYAGGTYAREPLPVDATARIDVASRDMNTAGGNRWRADEAPQPPADMPRSWDERPQPSRTAGYPQVQTNPHYAETNVGRAANRFVDERTHGGPTFDRPMNNRVDNRFAGEGYGDGRYPPRAVGERFDDRRSEVDRRADEDNRARAYNIGRERAQAERQIYPDMYRR